MANSLSRGRDVPIHLLAAAGIALLLLVAVIAGVQAKRRVDRRLAAHSKSEVNDFDRFLWMVPEFVHGDADYVNDRFPTPPITIAIFEPLTWISPADAQFVWACCKPLFAILIFWLCLSMAERAGATLEMGAMVLVLLAWFWPFIGDVQEGQTNLLMLTPLVLGLWLVQREERGAEWLGGILIGLAVCIKVTPLIFIAYFAWRRRGRVVAAAACGIALFLVIVPSVIFGPVRNTQWLIGWGRVMILPYVLHADVVYSSGESIPSMLTRFLRHVPAFGINRGVGVPLYFANITDLPEGVVRWIIRGVLGGIVLLAGGWMRRRLPKLRSVRYLAEVGVVAAVMLWASERTWVPHYVSMILPLMAVAAVGSGSGWPRRRLGAYGMLAAAVALMMMTSDLSKMVFGPNGRELALMYNVPLWATAGLVGVIVWAVGSWSAPGPARVEVGGRGEGVDLDRQPVLAGQFLAEAVMGRRREVP
ncbi:MAG: glycosyltransferase family 87 protein [Phycisphaerae bacterium]